MERIDLLGRWKVFVFTLIAVFLMVVIPKLGLFKSISIISPIPTNQEVINKIFPKLIQKDNHFSLSQPTQLIKSAQAVGDYQQAKAYVALDFDSGEIIDSKELSTPLPIASLTKIMTAIIALDLADPSDEFDVSYKATQIIPTKIGVKKGEKLTLEELLNSALLTSANDGVEVIRDGIDQKYDSPIFVDAMNEKAKFLKLNQTHFANPQGFDSSSNFSSVEDLAILSHYALSEYPLIAQIAKKDYQYLSQTSDHGQFDLYNWNGLIGVYPGVYGLKIGNTDDAGYTMVVASERNNQKILTVLLGAHGVLERDMWTAELLDSAYGKKLGLDPINVTEDKLREKYATWKYWH